MIPKSVYVYFAAAVLVFLGVWYRGEVRYREGAASRDSEVQALNTQLAGAAVALNQCNDQAKLNQEVAKAQRNMADAALDAATQRDKGRNKELADAVRKLTDARKTSDCKATAEAHLCPAMASY